MAKQLTLRLLRSAADTTFDAGCPINWVAVHRRACRLTRTLAPQNLANGFAIRAYADDAALLDLLRKLRTGRRQLGRAHRQPGNRLRIPLSVQLAVTTEGRRLNAVAARLEKRVAAREAAALCG